MLKLRPGPNPVGLVLWFWNTSAWPAAVVATMSWALSVSILPIATEVVGTLLRIEPA